METVTLLLLLAVLAVFVYVGYYYMSSKSYCQGLAAACKQGDAAALKYCQEHMSQEECAKYITPDGFGLDCTTAMAACK